LCGRTAPTPHGASGGDRADSAEVIRVARIEGGVVVEQ
jgi:hypothetical protein